MTVESKGDFSALFEGLKTYPQTLVNVRVKDKDAVLNAPSVLAAAEAAEKLLRAHRGRLLLRPSGTEPLVRILAEAEEEKIWFRRGGKRPQGNRRGEGYKELS